jgi:hypothetical protein
MEQTTLSTFAKIGQKIYDQYYGLEFENIRSGNFSLYGSSKGVSFSAHDYRKGCYVFVSCLENNNCTISMSNSFDSATGEPSEFDWLAFATSLLNKYDNADHRAILREISSQAKQRASKLENDYREAYGRINDIDNQTKQQ